MQQNSGQTKSLSLTTAERIGERIAFEIEVNNLEHFVALLASCGPFNSIGRCEKLKILDNFHVVIHAEKVRHVSNQSTDLSWLFVDRVIANVSFSPRWLQQRCDDSHRRRLARTIGANEAKQISLLEIELA